MMEFKGRPEKRQSSNASQDPQLQRRLWETSEQRTGVTYQFRTDAADVAPDKPEDGATVSDHQGPET